MIQLCCVRRISFVTLLQTLVFLPRFPLVSCVEVSKHPAKLQGANLSSLWLPTDSSKASKANTCELVQNYGYQCERHDVPITGTGYTVTIFRELPKTGGKNKVAYIQHGLLSSSDDWVSARANNLPCYLSDLGYEVWLGNIRGNTYGLQHSSWSIRDRKFWEFTMNEIGKDLYVLLNYVLDKSGRSKFYYVGHSMGSAMFTILSHYYSKFVERKSKYMVALAPAVFVKHATTPLARLSFIPRFLRQQLTESLITGGFVAEAANRFLQNNANIFCALYPTSWCNTVIGYITGTDFSSYSKEELARIVSHSPSSSCPYLLSGYIDMVRSGKFCQYDYGWWKNLQKYGSPTPPCYDLTRCKAKVFIICGGKDGLIVSKDCARLKQKLKSATVTDQLLANFNHMDFLFQKDADKDLYPLISKYFAS